MKKILSIIICVCILAFSLVACCGSGTAEASDEKENRFFIVEDVDVQAAYNVYRGYVMVDRETGVCYIYLTGSNRGAMSVLLDADGKPLIWEGKSRLSEKN